MNALFFSGYSGLATHINDALNKIGINTILLTTNASKRTNNPKTIKLYYTFSNRLDWYVKALRSFCYRHLYLNTKYKYQYYQDINENADYFNIEHIKSKINIVPDYIFILFDYRLLTTGSVKKLYDYYKVPIIWILVDMKPMTGGCSYSFDCTNYQIDCNPCPAISSSRHNGFACKTLEKKIKNLKDVDLKIITSSLEQYVQVSSSAVFKNYKKYKFFFPNNSELFCIQDKSIARQKLGLDINKKIIFFGAASFEMPRKGFKFLKEALLSLAKDDCSNILLLVAGKIPEDILNDIEIPKKMLGLVNMETLANAYQASDLFVCSSIADSGPTMVNQSIMCGTPVAAFEIGVCGDVIINGKTGMLVKLGDSEGLYRGIRYLLDLNEEQQDEVRKNCYEMSLRMKKEELIENIFTVLSD